MNNLEYIFPPKELLNNEKLDEKKYYKLSKLITKKDMKEKLLIPIGIDEKKSTYYIDLKNISGMFICGETGSGKSVFLDSIITTLLLKNTANELNLLLINPSKIEFMQYDGLPHLLTNLLYEKTDVINKLKDIIKIINQRQNKLIETKQKNIENYNNDNNEKMSHIIILIDESTDIMKEDTVTEVLEEILKNGKNVGVHLILSTSAYLKNEFNKKTIDLFDYIVSFDLATKEQASFINLKNADLLSVSGEVMIKSNSNIDKIQAPYVSTEEISNIVKFIIENNKAKKL